MREDQDNLSEADAEPPKGVYFDFLLETYRQASREMTTLTVVTRSIGLAGVFAIALGGPITTRGAMNLAIAGAVFGCIGSLHRLRLRRRLSTVQRYLGRADKSREDDFIRFMHYDTPGYSMPPVLRLYAEMFRFEEMIWMCVWWLALGTGIMFHS